ncbi:MAG: MSCRAMM family adhesin SdrC, partial [Myxococcales bacterium]|nr:MSCRAMM family adhesin SdrC [Myxococcales bacterium]
VCSGDVCESGCTGLSGVDTDGDGVCDDRDRCPAGDDALDEDGDGTPDACEDCPAGADTDADGVVDVCDVCPGADDLADTDGDGVCDARDVCITGNDAEDTDGDTVPNACDICLTGNDALDADGDTVPNACDVCLGNDLIDSDADTIPNACDTCEGFDDRLDGDGDGVADGCDRCAGGDDAADADRDGTCDALDLCRGIDSSGDVDSDGVCNNEDPCVGANASGDTDADGVCNDRDLCLGDDATGDPDNDRFCTDRDLCLGSNGTGDTDLDGICGNLDDCVGNDATGDSDGDNVCNDRDACLGDDTTGDADADGICGNLDDCLGNDATGDSDSDNVCNDRDDCVGNDATGDVDSDNVCNDRDDCIGNDATGDSDGDNVCNDRDDCVGNDATGDVDGDNVCNDRDDCVGNDATGDPDNDQICTDRDLCFGDNSLGDANGDGICDVLPGCTGDRSSGDSDADGVCNNIDNCVSVPNPTQQDGDVTGEWATAVPIAHLMRPSPANTVTLGDDAVSAAIPLGFAFPWFGTSQSQIQIASNGFIYVGTSAETNAACCSGPPLDTASINNIVALYWDDLNPLAGGTIRHGLVGTQYPREYVIEFNAINRYAFTDPITAQIILREDGAIELQCADCTTGTLSSHTQGIRGLTRGFAVPGRDSTEWSATASGYLFVTGSSAGPDGVGDACDTCAQVSSPFLATPARWAVAPAAVSVRGRPAVQGPATDDVVTPVSLGFTASTLGDSFSTVSVSSNGLLHWGASTTCFSCIGPFDILNPGDGLNGYAAVYNEDLNPSAGGSWWYGTQGVAPNREFVLSYEAIPHYSVGQPVTAQIVIREADSSVELICVNCPSNGGDSHTQGVENAAGTIGLALGGRARSSTFSPVNDAVRVFPVACQP